MRPEAVLVFSLVLSSSFNAIFFPDHRCAQVEQLETQSPSSERLKNGLVSFKQGYNGEQ